MEGRPLADDFAVGARILDLIGRDAGQVIGGDIAHAVAARLDGVHLHGGQLREDVRNTSASLGQFSCRFWRVVKWP